MVSSKHGPHPWQRQQGHPNFFPVLGSKHNPSVRPSRQKDFSGFTEVLEGNLHEDPGMTLQQRTSQVGKESLTKTESKGKTNKTKQKTAQKKSQVRKCFTHPQARSKAVSPTYREQNCNTETLRAGVNWNTQEPGAVFGTVGGNTASNGNR